MNNKDSHGRMFFFCKFCFIYTYFYLYTYFVHSYRKNGLKKKVNLFKDLIKDQSDIHGHRWIDGYIEVMSSVIEGCFMFERNISHNYKRREDLLLSKFNYSPGIFAIKKKSLSDHKKLVFLSLIALL